MQCMEDDGQTYLLPHPAVTRVIMTLAGLFALIVAPYELLGAVWPPSVLTPFFGFIMLGAMTVGSVFVYAGVATPSGKLVFHDGSLEVHKNFLRSTRRYFIGASDIEAVEVQESASSDGPSDWYAVIRATGHRPIGSRPLGRQEAAEELAETFRRMLGLEPLGGHHLAARGSHR